MISFLFLILILFTGLVLGIKVLDLLKIGTDRLLEKSLFAIGLGLGVIAYSVYLIGILKILYRPVLYIFIFGLILFLYKDVIAFLTPLCPPLLRGELKRGKIPPGPLLPKGEKREINKFDKIILIILSSTVLLNLIGALAPETIFDAIWYHLALPKIYLSNHKIFFVSYEDYAAFPRMMEMLFLLGMSLFSDIVSKLIHFSMGALTAAAIYSLSRKFFSVSVSIMAAAIFYCAQTVNMLSATAYIDLGLVFYEFLAVYAFVNWITSDDSKWLYLSAIMVGFSLGIKHYGILLLAVLLIGIIIKFIVSSLASPLTLEGVAQGRGKTYSNLIKNLFVFGAVAFAIASPWYLDSYINTGNPVYPLFNTVFNTGSSWESRMFATTGKKGWYDGHSLSQYITLPWKFMTGEFEGWLSPIFLFLLPLGLIIKNKNKYFKISLIFGFLFYTIYFAVVPFYTLRYFLPLLPVLSVSAAYIWEEVSRSDKNLKIICSTLIMAVFISNLGFLSFKNIPIAKAAFGIESKDKYLTEVLGWYGVNQYIKDNLDKKDLVLVGGAPLFYYFDFNYTYGLDTGAKSAAELSEKLKEKNVSYVLYLIGSIDYSDTAKYFELVYNLGSPPPKSSATRGAKLYKVK